MVHPSSRHPNPMITLIRHGRPDLMPWGWHGRAAFRRFLAHYDSVAIDPAWPPPADLVQRVNGAGAVFASTAARARTSAELLLADRLPAVDPIFAEAPVSVPFLPIPLPLPAWMALGRLGWLAGLGAAAETRRGSGARAGAAAGLLAEAAERHGAAVLVGHGWFNRLIGEALRTRGWRGEPGRGHDYWSHRSYHRE